MAIPSCSPDPPDYGIRIENLRVQAEEMLRAQSVMGWNTWAFGEPSNLDSLYEANSALFSAENIDLVRKAEEAEKNTLQKKRLRYFRRFLTTEYIAKANAPLSDEASNLESNATVNVRGKEIRYRDLSVMLANEPNQLRRAELYSAADRVLDSLNLIYDKFYRNTYRVAKELGYPTYNEMIEELKGVSLDEFKEIAKDVLNRTGDQYKTLLHQVLESNLRLDTGRFYRYDTGALFRSKRFDKWFSQGSMLEVLSRTLMTLGVDIAAQPNLRIDAEQRPAKNPRAVCYPVNVPDDIRLSIKPIGGFDDYSALFHEMGHGQHYANTIEHAFEFKYLGEPTVTECFAFLSEYLLSNQAWLRLHTRMPTPVLKDFLKLQAFYRLYYVRRYCAKFLYEHELHSGTTNPQVRYASLQAEAIGHIGTPSDEKRYLADVDLHYYSMGYLRAWFLEAQLSAMLTKSFGANWFENPEAGAYLRSLWAAGDRMTGEELASTIGYDTISPDEFLRQIEMMILFSVK